MFELPEETRATALKLGLTDEKTLSMERASFDAFIHDLGQEWTPERVREYMVYESRKRYAKLVKKQQQLESANVDARAKGVPYSERKHYSHDIEVIEKVKKDTEAKGRACKELYTTDVRFIVRPEDMSTIKRLGFKMFINLKYLNG